jgi:predicted kinase
VPLPASERRVVVVSGAPGTGKSTVAALLASGLGFQVLGLDPVKEALADVLGLGGEDWSNRVGDAAAEIVFRLARTSPGAVAEGWWRRERRERALVEFAGCVEVFCRCPPALAVERARARLTGDRHPIHRDVIDPALLDTLERVVTETEPLGLAGGVVVVDTAGGVDPASLVSAVRPLVASGAGSTIGER